MHNITLTSKERKIVYDFLYAAFQFYLLNGYAYPQQLKEIGKTCYREGDDSDWRDFASFRRSDGSK